MNLKLLIAAVALALLGIGLGPVPSVPDSEAPGIIKGTVKFEGMVPKPTHIDMSDDPKCLKAHPNGATQADIVTDGKEHLRDVVVFISEGLGDRTFEAPSEPAVFEQKGCMYQPHVLAMRGSQRLDVTNLDTTTHNIHPMPRNNREWNKSQAPGVPVEETFAREEVAIPVKCNVHPWMKGYIAVLKHPYFAVTGADGEFELKNVPPGTYTIQAWHEKLEASAQKVTVGASETKTIDFVFKQRTEP